MTILFSMKSENKQRTVSGALSTSFFTLLFLASFLSATAQDDKANWEEGKSMFKSNCASCHNPKADGTGPALAGVTARWEAAGDFKGKSGKEWLHVWIHNWHDAVNAGDKYAVDMSNSRPSEMNVFMSLKPEDIDKILLYVENADKYKKEVPPPPPGDNPTTEAKGPGSVMYVFVSFLLLLVIILIIVTNKLDKIVAEKAGEPVVAKKAFSPC